MKKIISHVSIFALVIVSATVAGAQIRLPQASQKASVMQAIGTTDLTINYFRPMVKGRKVWGDWPVKVEGEATLDTNTRPDASYPMVPNGHVWRTGANAATQFIVTDEVLINGKALPAGSYSLHSIPGKDSWTIIFNTVAEQGGSFSYDAKKDALRVTTKPEWMQDNLEALAFIVEPMSETTAKVNIRWEKINVPFTVEVKDPVGATLARIRTAVANAKADDFNSPFQAANYARDKKMPDDAAKWYGQALAVADAELKAGETYRANLRKFNALAALGRGAEAVPFGEKAVTLGKAATPKVDTAALEKRIADMKAAKN